jgi:hypothetical protein
LLVGAITPVKARLEKVARRLTSDPAAAPAYGADGTTGGIPEALPTFDDPVFLAALDERIRAVAGRIGDIGPSPGSNGISPRGGSRAGETAQVG